MNLPHVLVISFIFPEIIHEGFFASAKLEHWSALPIYNKMPSTK